MVINDIFLPLNATWDVRCPVAMRKKSEIRVFVYSTRIYVFFTLFTSLKLHFLTTVATYIVLQTLAAPMS